MGAGDNHRDDTKGGDSLAPDDARAAAGEAAPVVNALGAAPAALSRAELLRMGLGRAKQSGAIVASYALEEVAGRVTARVQRPPGALPELEFLMACTRCDACIDACPPGALLRLDTRAGLASGTPYLDVNNHKPCTACVDTPCSAACPTGALIVEPITEAWMGTARIDRETCRAWHGQSCRSCFQICPRKDLAVLIDDDGRVFIDPRECIGCGLCVVVCPTRPRSIEVEPPSIFR